MKRLKINFFPINLFEFKTFNVITLTALIITFITLSLLLSMGIYFYESEKTINNSVLKSSQMDTLKALNVKKYESINALNVKISTIAKSLNDFFLEKQSIKNVETILKHCLDINKEIKAVEIYNYNFDYFILYKENDTILTSKLKNSNIFIEHYKKYENIVDKNSKFIIYYTDSLVNSEILKLFKASMQRYSLLKNALEREFEKKFIKNFLILVIIALILAITIVVSFYLLEKKIRSYSLKLQELNRDLQNRVNSEIKNIREKDKLLIQQSKMAAMGEMIGNIAHQWRQPLNELGLIIQSFEIALFSNKLSENFIEDRVKKGQKVIENMSSTIDDFRNFFKPNKKKEYFDLAKAIKDTLLMNLSGLKSRGIDSNFIDGEVIKIYGYQNEFKQVILNVINNSKDAILERKIDGKIEIKIVKENDFVKIIIRDNGGGIKEKIINKVFEPYFTTKGLAKGTGIGLYMSKMIIEDNMNGKIDIKNIEWENEMGLEFNIILPIKEDGEKSI